MTKAVVALAMAAALAGSVSACSDPSDLEVGPGLSLVDGPVELTLRAEERKRVPGTVVEVSFVRVTEDSRCPVDVTCVWAGNAVVEVGVSVGTGPSVLAQVNTSLEPRTVTVNGVALTVLELTPVPHSGAPIDPNAYVVKLRLAAG